MVDSGERDDDGDELPLPPSAQPSCSTSKRKRPAHAATEEAAAVPKAKRRRSTSVPRTAVFSTRAGHDTRKLISKRGLKSDGNLITHSKLGENTQHYVSSSTGHQVASRLGAGPPHGAISWAQSRFAKLKAQSCQQTSDLLKGVVVHINGFTDGVPHSELMHLIQQYGGIVTYTPSAKTTHTISSNPLSAKKMHLALTSKKLASATRLVRPEWVLDSIREGKRLDEGKYGFKSETQPTLGALWADAGKKAGRTQVEIKGSPSDRSGPVKHHTSSPTSAVAS